LATRLLHVFALATLLGVGSVHTAHATPSTGPFKSPLRQLNDIPALSSAAVPSAPGDTYKDVLKPEGASARGLYISGPVIRKIGLQGIIERVQKSHSNAVVIDLKDDRGRVNYATQIASIRSQARPIHEDLKKLLAELKQAKVYTIARIVCFNDNSTAGRYPERAIHDVRSKDRLWLSFGARTRWLDPYNKANHELIIALAKDAEALGFEEIQLDYIRFPVDPGTRFARFPAHGSVPRRLVLQGLLREIDRSVHIPLGVDVFGLTAFHQDRSEGLGQALEDWVPYVEVFSPMLYLNNMKSWGLKNSVNNGKPQARAMRLVQAGVRIMRRRLGSNIAIRPYLQAFRPGADYYNPRFIAEQIAGAKDGSADGYLFWNPGSTYSIVEKTMASDLDARHAFDRSQVASVPTPTKRNVPPVKTQ